MIVSKRPIYLKETHVYAKRDLQTYALFTTPEAYKQVDRETHSTDKNVKKKNAQETQILIVYLRYD